MTAGNPGSGAVVYSGMRCGWHMALVVTIGAGCAGVNRAEPASVAAEYANIVTAPPSTSTLRVVTFNAHGASGRDIAIALESSPATAGADVILLQEVERHPTTFGSRPARAAALLGLSYAYAPGYGLARGGSHGVAILSRYPLRDVEVVELPRYRVVFNSARRVAVGATADVGGTPIRLYSVHLDNRVNPRQRQRQLEPVLRRAARASPHPVIIGGDVNTSPFCWLAHVVPVPCGVQDQRLEAYVRRRGFATPVIASGPTSQWLGMRLDAIYTRGLTVRRYGVERRVRLSDHLPLWAVMTVEPTAR